MNKKHEINTKNIKKTVILISTLILIIISGTNVLAVPISTCQIIDTSGLYELSQDVSSADTCFTINASDVSLDCLGHNISFSTSATGHGVHVLTELDNITVKNCNVHQQSTSSLSNAVFTEGLSTSSIITNVFLNNLNLSTKGTVGAGSRLKHTYNSNLSNIQINQIGGASYGLYISNSASSKPGLNVSRVSINSTGSSTNYGVFFHYSSNNIFEDFVIDVVGYGLKTAYAFRNTLFKNMTITASGFSGDSISGGTASHSNIRVMDSSLNSSRYAFDAAISNDNNVTFINTTMDKNKINVQDTHAGVLHIGWYVDIDTSIVEGVNITWTDSGTFSENPSKTGSGLTNSSGKYQTMLYESSRNATHVFNYNNYTINISKNDYFCTKNINITNSTEITCKFISLWKTDNPSGTGTNNTQIALPLEESGNYDFTVKSDALIGSPVHITSHTQNILNFTSAGTHEIIIEGVIKNFRFNNGGDREKIMEIKQWGSLNLGNNGGYFYGAENLNVTATDRLRLTNTTNLTQAFKNTYNLNKIENIGQWDISKITHMSEMFSGTNLETQNYDALLNGWAAQQSIQYDVVFDAGNSNYTINANNSRNILINTYNWTIYDGGPQTSILAELTNHPTTNITLTKNISSNLEFSITCYFGDCGEINATLKIPVGIYFESFETDLGTWQNDLNHVEDWEINSGSTTSSSTGPSSAQNESYYVYVETSSSGANNAGDESILEYNETNVEGIDFYYHQYGTDQGTLYLEGYNGSQWIELWSSAGNQGDTWIFVSERFDNYEKIRFRNVAAGGYWGDVALDALKVYESTELKTNQSTIITNYLNENDTQTIIFTLNATGEINETYYLELDAQSTNFSQVHTTEEIQITITEHMQDFEINFTEPTPPNNAILSNYSTFLINNSILSSNLKKLFFNWNSEAYPIYNEDLILMMNFDNRTELGENSSFIYDSSIYENYGSFQYGAEFHESGKYDGAIYFPGTLNNSVVIPYSSEFQNIADSLTLSIWAYPTTYGGDYVSVLLGQNSVEGYQNYALGLLNDNKIRFRLNIAGYNNLISNSAIPLNTWTHIMGIYNGTHMLIYLNGELDASRTMSGNVENRVFPILMGSDTIDPAGRSYEGFLDEPRIWNNSLSPNELQQIYKSNLKKINETNWELLTKKTNIPVGSHTYKVSGTNVQNQNTETETRTVTSSNQVFRTVWKTDNPTGAGTSNTQIALPLEADGTYNFYVVGTNLIGSPVHITSNTQNILNFTSVGEHEINITGTINGWRFNNAGDRQKILEIKQWGPLRLGNNNGYFYGASNLQITATDSLILTGTTNLFGTFRDCSNIALISNMNDWDVSNVTNMASLFQGASSFNQNISNWNVSSVTNMGSMFSGATSFNQDISSWDMSNVERVRYMFYDAITFNQDISLWNVSELIFADNLFAGAISFNQDISNWDISKVINADSMFHGATSFNQPLSSWNTSNIATMNNMFADATSFNQNIGSWDVSGVTSMTGMFQGVTLSTQNYDSILIGWASQTPNLQDDVSFHGGNSKYSFNAVSARNDTLIGIHNWAITDGGPAARVTLEIIAPTESNVNFTQNEFFNVQIRANCLFSDCGEINSAIYYKTTNNTQNWFNTSWPYRKEITINYSNVYEDVNDFPIYVDLSHLGADFFDEIKTNGEDIRITTSDSVTQLPREVVSVNAASDEGELHFKGNLSATTNTKFYIYYGNTAATEPANTSQYGRDAVWSDYVAVWHLDDGSSDQLDSSGNDNTATRNTGGVDAQGILGRGLEFDGTGRYDLTTAITSNGGDVGISFWYNPDNQGGGNYGSILGSNDYAHGIRHLATDSLSIRSGGTIQASTPDVINSQWDYVSFEWNGANWAARASKTAGTGSGTNWFGSNPIHLIGINGATDRAPDGILEEIRIGPARTANFRDTEYENQMNPTTFYEISDVETGSESSSIMLPENTGTPFYTTQNNPYSLTLNEGQSQTITFSINATGPINETYTFFAFANITSMSFINDITDDWFVTIVEKEILQRYANAIFFGGGI